jgi:hypothetical protein
MGETLPSPPGCITKKWLFYVLRPQNRVYRAEVVREFFTPDRLERCQIQPDEFPRIRVFSPVASYHIKNDLKSLNFIK